MQLIVIKPTECLDRNVLSEQIGQVIDDEKVKKRISHALILTEKWIKNTLSKPHPKLGRRGPVCPYIPRASVEGHLYLSYCLYSHKTTVKEVCDLMQNFQIQFHSTNDSFLNSIVIPFVPIDDESGDEKATLLVEKTQKRLKRKFIKSSSMIGQFFPKCPVVGLHSKDFRPFEFKVPCLAIRNLMPQDVVFVSDSQIHAQVYLDRFKIDSRNALISLLKQNGVGGNRNVINHVDHIFESRKVNGA